MNARRLSLFVFFVVVSLCWSQGPAGPKLPKGHVLEEQPASGKAKIVLIAGSNYFKKGEHDYIAASAVLADTVKQSGAGPVLALDWPKDSKTLADAKAVVFFFDGAAKHGLLKGDRFAEIKKLADAGTGLVFLHQGVDVPKDFGDRFRELAGAAFENGYSQRAHWVDEFKQFPTHPITRGVTPFKTDDGYLYKLRFVPNMKGVTPLLKTVNPKGKAGAENDAIVAWAYDRPDGGRTFSFTGGHLHASLGEEGYRRFLTNAILWSAGQEIPSGGAPVALTDLNAYLTAAPPAAKK